jgi:hypothetical protein
MEEAGPPCTLRVGRPSRRSRSETTTTIASEARNSRDAVFMIYAAVVPLQQEVEEVEIARTSATWHLRA